MRRAPTILLVVALIAACSGGSSPSPSHNVDNPLAGVRFWAYQLHDQTEGDSLDTLVASHYDLLVVDQTRSLRGDERYDSAADVAALKASPSSSGGRKIVLAYIDVGEAESYRWYWQEGWRAGEPDWIVAPDPDGWDENYPVQFWRREWKAIVEEYVERIIEDGYDGIYLDWLEVYSFEPVAEAAQAEGLDPRLELIDFVSELRQHARSSKADFLFVAQNAAELGELLEYVDLFDAVAQEAIWNDGGGDPDTGDRPGDVPVDPELTREYLENLQLWQQRGKPVLHVEYAAQSANAERAYRLGKEAGFVTYVTLRPLDSLSDTPPPGY